MAQIKTYPLLHHLRADAASYIQQFRRGRRVRSGRGLAFWFAPDGASISEIPVDDRETPFLLKAQSADYQELTVQGSLVWRVADAEKLGERIDFTLDLQLGLHVGQPLDQINNTLVNLARRFTAAYLKGLGVRDVLERGIAPLQAALEAGFSDHDVLAEMGVQLVRIGVADVAPGRELARALQAPTFESLQQKADEATFARRALAVDKERAIAENELNNKIELAAREQRLIAHEDENGRSRASAVAAAMRIDSEAEAERIRTVDQARADMERERIAVYADLPPLVLLAMAAQEFAGKLERIDNLTITPDMLSGLMGQLKGALAYTGATVEAQE